MPRVKRGVTSHKRHKKVLERAKGMRGARSRVYSPAHEAVMHALAYAYRDRRNRKRDMRKLWIMRINAASRLYGLSYSKFVHGLALANITVNRKMLADMAVYNGAAFGEIAKQAAVALQK